MPCIPSRFFFYATTCFIRDFLLLWQIAIKMNFVNDDSISHFGRLQKSSWEMPLGMSCSTNSCVHRHHKFYTQIFICTLQVLQMCSFKNSFWIFSLQKFNILSNFNRNCSFFLYQGTRETWKSDLMFVSVKKNVGKIYLTLLLAFLWWPYCARKQTIMGSKTISHTYQKKYRML